MLPRSTQQGPGKYLETYQPSRRLWFIAHNAGYCRPWLCMPGANREWPMSDLIVRKTGDLLRGWHFLQIFSWPWPHYPFTEPTCLSRVSLHLPTFTIVFLLEMTPQFTKLEWKHKLLSLDLHTDPFQRHLCFLVDHFRHETKCPQHWRWPILLFHSYSKYSVSI